MSISPSVTVGTCTESGGKTTQPSGCPSKAMIFTWLRAQGREKDKAAVYGYTRSWSKRGSAVGALLGAGFALWVGDFTRGAYEDKLALGRDVVRILRFRAPSFTYTGSGPAALTAQEMVRYWSISLCSLRQ